MGNLPMATTARNAAGFMSNIAAACFSLTHMGGIIYLRLHASRALCVPAPAN